MAIEKEGEIMLSRIMRSINNHFAIDRLTGKFYGIETGIFNLIDKTITVKYNYVLGQYIYLHGSILNDGVYQVINIQDGVITLDSKDQSLHDEKWGGTIYSLRVPNDFLQLIGQIENFEMSSDGKASNITSATFGIQSTTFGTNDQGVKAGWQDVFRQELHKYRRHTPDIEV